MSKLPIVVLAFANEQEGRRYLRDLPEELRRLQDVLKEAERNGLCRLEVLSNASLDQIFDVFTRNRDQVAIFHYGGHADSGRLLLESSTAGGATAYAAGLATFLGQCGGLQLVFLNGCSTRGQVARLLEAGVAAVIATGRAIDDAMAREFAVAFYTELASGAPLRSAYDAARGRVLAAHDCKPEAYYGHRDLGATADSASPDPSDDQGFPWEFRPQAELVEHWCLPDAAGNPEFGLPRLPERDLPESPFRPLNWFTAEHAEVFFGREYQVRELYAQITDTTGPPVLLLYGASGVGKSSLLDAGLVPRLAAGGQVVRYCRRDPQKGLTASLCGALQVATEQTALDEGWRAEETRIGKPLLVFLDQVEEVFTHPDPSKPHELDEFVAMLSAALSNRDRRPQGKLVLGFRKEWLAELDRRLAEAKLPRNKVFLEALDRRGIIEAIRGPARPGRLERQYRLAIEDGLPEIIADDLLSDAGSALASTLQVLLTKMWERACAAKPDGPRFDHGLYQSLKAEGYLLKDLLDEGLKAAGRWNAAVEQSGLAIDVLVYHTTDLGTAAQRTRTELSERYAHQRAMLDGLLNQFEDDALLIEADLHPDTQPRSTRLAHDLLAPLVQHRFRLSLAPGQRARRLLENRAPEWKDGKTGPVLDSTDLATALEGAAGMRIRTAEETLLVEASRRAEEQRKADEEERARRLREAEERQRQAEVEKQRITEQRLKDQQEANQRLRTRAVALAATLAVTVGVALLAVLERRTARHETARATIAGETASKQTQRAEKSDRLADAHRLAACSREALATRPQQALILAVEAIRATRDHGEPIALAAEQALQDALTSVHGRTLSGDTGQVSAFAIAPDGQLVTGSTDGTVWVWDLNHWVAKPLVSGRDADPVNLMGFAPDGRLVTGGASGSVVVWDLHDPASKHLVLAGHQGAISALAFAPDGRHLVTGGQDRTVRVWDLKSPSPAAGPIVLKDQPFPVHSLAFAHDGRLAVGGLGPVVFVYDLTKPESPIRLPLGGRRSSVAFAPDGRLVIANTMNGVVHVWDSQERSSRRAAHRFRNGGTSAMAFAQNGQLVIGGNDGAVRIWDLNERPAGVTPHKGHEHGILALGSAPDGRLVTGGQDGTVRLWDRKNMAADPVVLHGHDGAIKALAFVPDGRLVTTGLDGTARVWDLKSPASQSVVLGRHDGKVTALEFAPDGRLATGGVDGVVTVWDLKNRSQETLFLHGERRARVRVRALAFAPDGRLAALGHNGSVQVWDPRPTSAAPRILGGHRGVVNALAFAADGRLVTAGSDGTAQVWNDWSSSAGSILLRCGTGPVTALAFARDGRLATVTDEGPVQVWDLKKPDAPQPVPESQEVRIHKLAFAADGRLVAGGEDGAVLIWNLKGATITPISLRGHWNDVIALSFAPDGRLVTAAADDPDARVWDLRETGAEPLILHGPRHGISAAGFAPDGRLVMGGDDGTVRVWDLDVEHAIELARLVSGRNLTAGEWEQFFGQEPYRRTFKDLPDGAGVKEARGASDASRSGTPDSTAARIE
jgi:WD40 repeat protein